MAESKAKALWRDYTFKTEPIPRLPYDSLDASKRISKGLPCVLEGSELAGPALQWTNDYLEEHIGDGKFSVFISKSHIFKYFDDKKVSGHKHFKPSMDLKDMTFAEFNKRLKSPSQSNERLYLQQSLNSGVGKQIVDDFVRFNWSFINAQALKNKWGPLTSNLLLIGQEGNVTPCHYDEQENFYAQLVGEKRVILFPPSNFECMYTYPVHHPHDRQCQVDFENPNYELFPKFRNVTGVEAILKPGDVLYLPMYWFHHFESWLHGGPTTSLTFWYKSAPTGDVVYPLTAHQKIAITRNLEKMINEALRNVEEVAPFFSSLVLGRFTHDPDRPPAPSATPPPIPQPENGEGDSQQDSQQDDTTKTSTKQSDPTREEVES